MTEVLNKRTKFCAFHCCNATFQGFIIPVTYLNFSQCLDPMIMTDNNDLIYEADTQAFSESPTLVSNMDGTDKLSVYSLPSQMDVSQQSIRSSGIQAPETDSYTITHEITFGGYGTIWNGIQKSLNRRVALKSLKSEVTASPSYDRLSRLFRQEAITTAYLQHPNVVPVHDLTSGNDGQPILAMKLVEGRQWNRVLADDYANLPALEFLEVHLPILVSVGQAVAYAHSRGIIHRDIKPSQVMIGNYGEVLLMDWGLAMASRDSDGQVLCDSSIIIDALSPLVKPPAPAGTPGYMAPEQTSKDASRIGPWTDIYLLGAVLYELLTGFKPHGAESQKATSALPRDNQIAKPEARTPDRDIPAQLSMLAMKAMQTNPSDRAPTASFFVQEITDYLAKAGRRGESMSLVTSVANFVISEEHTYEHLQSCLDKLERALAQWPENHMAGYLRHQIRVTFARTALGNHDLKLARLHAERVAMQAERESLLREIETAEQEFHMKDTRIREAHTEAREERDRGEELVRFLLLDLHQELKSLGRADLVHQVASQALRFFDSLRESETNQTTLQNRCLAYLQIGTVQSEQGRRHEAEGAFGKAKSIAQTLIAAAPDNVEWFLLKARCFGQLGKLHYIMGRMDVAISELDESLNLNNDALQITPNDKAIRCQIGHLKHDMAMIYWRTQEYQKAFEKLEDCTCHAREFHKNDPANSDYQDHLAMCLTAQSLVMRDSGNLHGATQAAYEALALRIALTEQLPSSLNRSEAVCWIRADLASLLLAAGDFDGALENLRQDLPTRRRLLESDNDNVLRMSGLTFQLSLMAQANFLLFRTDEAERLLSECLVHSQRLAQQDEHNPEAVSNYALHLIQMAELLASRNNWADAERIAAQALERARYSYWLAPQSTFAITPLAQALAFSARINRRNGNNGEAARLITEANETLQRITGSVDSASIRSLKARVILDAADKQARQNLVEELQSLKRLDPYLKAWIENLPASLSA